MENILSKICDTKKDEVAEQKKIHNQDFFINSFSQLPVAKEFLFKKKIITDLNEKGLAVIAEIKKASPSKGVISKDFDVKKVASSYTINGASCLSVLTDNHYFMGDISYLNLVKNVTDLPILRKDFIIDEYQIYQSKFYKADCILLIASILDSSQLLEFENIAHTIGLDVLVEIHDVDELKKIENMKTSLIGINNRNLKTFQTDITNSINLGKLIPGDKIVVTESGINTKEDIDLMKKNKIKTFLIGERFMRESDPGSALKSVFR